MSTSNNKPTTGSKSVTDTASTLTSSGSLVAGVWITVPSSAANGIEVRGLGASAGDKMGVGETKFFPAFDLDDVTVIRDGGSNVTVSYYAL